MSKFSPDEIEKVLDNVRNKISEVVQCDEIRGIESNINTKSMVFKDKDDPDNEGSIIAGEDKEVIAVDISTLDGAVRSFILESKADKRGINNIVGWFRDNY